MVDGKIRLERKQTAIQFISTKGVWEEEQKEIISIIRDYFEKIENLEYYYIGWVFGKYDIVIEFCLEDAKVASYHACKIQEKIDKFNERKDKGRKIYSTLSLSRRVGMETGNSNDFIRKPKGAIVAYVFMNIRYQLGEQNLQHLLKDILYNLRSLEEDSETRIELFWNASTYFLLLRINGNCYNRIYKELIEFKKLMKGLVLETCSYFVLRYDESIGETTSDTRASVDIPAIMYVKMKQFSAQEERELRDKRLRISEDWYSTWFYSSGSIPEHFGSHMRKPGWHDVILGIRKGTLKEILQAILRFKHINKELIHHTSTYTLFMEEG
ncbi:MAG: hypothetical protein WBA22_10505 [Candidatus Methanofastidiosia archaeon]